MTDTLEMASECGLALRPARTEMPAREGAVISVATGVVLGNEIRVGGQR
jgi:hypothetical protein